MPMVAAPRDAHALSSMASRKKSASRAKRAAPWDHAAPKSSTHRRLTPAMKTVAKRRAKKAGRRYPNLVDNMAVASGRARHKRPARKASS